MFVFAFFFKQKTAYELRISDWSSDVCSSDLERRVVEQQEAAHGAGPADEDGGAVVVVAGEQRWRHGPAEACHESRRARGDCIAIDLAGDAFARLCTQVPSGQRSQVADRKSGV